MTEEEFILEGFRQMERSSSIVAFVANYTDNTKSEITSLRGKSSVSGLRDILVTALTAVPRLGRLFICKTIKFRPLRVFWAAPLTSFRIVLWSRGRTTSRRLDLCLFKMLIPPTRSLLLLAYL